MRGFATVLVGVFASVYASAQPHPGLQIDLIGGPASALQNPQQSCDTRDYPDAPARAIRLTDGTVQLYATDHDNRVNVGPDLVHLHHNCVVVYRGHGDDDPAAYDDRSWITSLWTKDGRTIWAVLHNEFQGQLRKQLCPTGRYMDCWFNALALTVSHDAGRSFQRTAGNSLVATLPYRYDEVGLGHHGYFNPSNIVRLDGGLYMFAFATQANAQQGGNCLLRTETIEQAGSWRGWGGTSFNISFTNPYVGPVQPEHHVCVPIDAGVLRWPVTSLVRHEPSGLFVVLMQNAAHDGGVFYATSTDLLHWSAPMLLLSAIGLQAWTCGDPNPIAYPSLLDPASNSRNFDTVGAGALLFATRFDGIGCNPGASRSLVRWAVRIRLRT